MPYAVFFKYNVIHARLFQVVADGETGLSASDDDDGIVIVHSEQFSFLLKRTRCNRKERRARRSMRRAEAANGLLTVAALNGVPE